MPRRPERPNPIAARQDVEAKGSPFALEGRSASDAITGRLGSYFARAGTRPPSRSR
jgi:hypothetical protein